MLKKGLSAGTVPSGLMRRILPKGLARFCELESATGRGSSSWLPTATYSLPSGPKRSAPPMCHLVAAGTLGRSRITRSLPGTTVSFASVTRRMRLWGAGVRAVK